MTSRAAASTVIHREEEQCVETHETFMKEAIRSKQNTFWHKINNNLKNKDHFDPYNVFLAIATNIPVRLKTGFVVQGHICVCVCVCDPGPQKQS